MTKEKTNDIIVYHLGDNERRVKKMARSPEAIKRAKAKYNEKVVKVTIELYPTDKELIEKLQEQPSKQRYIKDLIRRDILGEIPVDPVQQVYEERMKALEKRNYLKSEKDIQ